MSNRGLRNIFIIGSLLFFAVFVALTYDTMRQHDSRVPEITADVDLGKKVWHKYDCIGCHTIFGNGSYFAPDLTKTTVAKPAGYVKKFLMNPRKVKPGAAMPVLGITADEAEKLVVFLDWVSKVDTNDWPPKPILASMIASGTEGSAIFKRNGCNACHMIGGLGGTSGPDLSRAGARQPSAEWHMRHLKDPASVVEDSAMPPYAHLSEDDLAKLTNYMLSLK